MKIGKCFKFDSAHYLPDYKGKCRWMHGHTWTLTVEVEGELNEDTGMVLDFAVLAKEVEEAIRLLDHNSLNTFIYKPTCENILLWIRKALSNSKLLSSFKLTLQLREGEGGYAILQD